MSVDAPPGITVNVSPSSLTLANGASATYQVTFTTQSGAALDEWTFGSLTWSDGSHGVRSPIAIKPVPSQLHLQYLAAAKVDLLVSR